MHAFWALCCDVVSRYFSLHVSTTYTYFVISNLCVGAFKYFVQYKTMDSRPNLFLMVENQRLDFLFQCTKFWHVEKDTLGDFEIHLKKKQTAFIIIILIGYTGI